MLAIFLFFSSKPGPPDFRARHSAAFHPAPARVQES